ncbi:MAG: hypothetical protein IPG04_04485 [Polyangiaceae bacterium]|nr:hypothetical protein [Polyangiaceae bacterium]
MNPRLERSVYAIAGLVTLVTVLRPFWVATYPPMTDLPFHAAQTSILRHYLDPAWHFREQFELRPIAVPYASSYALGALFMLVLPAVQAVKAATAVMLLMLPLGLGTLAWGMRKTPLLGLLALPFAWCNLTHWGFVNFVASLGLFAAVLGLTMRALDVPTRRTQAALAATLVLLFFTHVFRFPFALLGMAVVTLALYPLTRRVAPAAWPTLPALGLFASFWLARPKAVGGHELELTFEWARREQLLELVIGSFNDPAEADAAKLHLVVAGLAAAAGVAAKIVTRRSLERADLRWEGLATLAVLVNVIGLFAGFLTLPMEIGVWWYVFPREATAVLFVAMALVPDLPKHAFPRLAVVALMSWSGWRASSVAAENWAKFDATTRDFDAVTEAIPQAPRLLYLVFDHTGSTRKQTPYIHLPAYVQATRGGHLSFHFAMWDAGLVRYRRDPGAIVPPAVPLRWEWQPARFRVREHGPFFDWFLVRSKTDPGRLFEADPAIIPVKHGGTWWLYRRAP